MDARVKPAHDADIIIVIPDTRFRVDPESRHRQWRWIPGSSLRDAPE
jgi:hypothetical protein